jgi:hopene-associated glycosyltransferase HpnB
MVALSEHCLAALPLLIWCYLLLAHGGFWRIPRQFPPVATDGEKSIVAVIPARDEAAVIGDTVRSLLSQRYGGSIHVIVVDDGSSDGTAEAATEAAANMAAAGVGAASAGPARQLTVITGAALPAGWTGKLWAMSQGVAAAAALAADYLLFTDADIHHDASNVAALVANAESHGRDLVSYMVELPVVGRAEKLLIPAFVFFFLQLYPPRWIAAAGARTAGAAGGCLLMRPQALVRLGGLAAIRSQLIDDCALARAAKSSGSSIWLGLTHTARSTRSYDSWRQIAHMISRSAFNQLHHSYALLLATIAGLGLTYVLPPLLLLSRDPVLIALGALAWALMTVSYAPMVRFYRLSPLWSLCLPLIALFYAAATLHSALQYRLRRGGQWKGRIQDTR